LISIEEIDMIFFDEAERVECVALGVLDDGVVWVFVEQWLREDLRLSFVFIAFMILVVLIVGVGCINDQLIFIVGVMVVGFEFVFIVAICFVLVYFWFGMIFVVVRVLVIGFGVVIVIVIGVWVIVYVLGAFICMQVFMGDFIDFIV